MQTGFKRRESPERGNISSVSISLPCAFRRERAQWQTMIQDLPISNLTTGYRYNWLALKILKKLHWPVLRDLWCLDCRLTLSVARKNVSDLRIRIPTMRLGLLILHDSLESFRHLVQVYGFIRPIKRLQRRFIPRDFTGLASPYSLNYNQVREVMVNNRPTRWCKEVDGSDDWSHLFCNMEWSVLVCCLPR